MDDFAAKLKAALEPKGATLDEAGRMVRIEGFAGDVQITDAQIRYHNERLGLPDAQAAQRHAWIERLMDLVTELDADGVDAHWAALSNFWICLDGVIVQMWMHSLQSVTILGDLSTAAPRPDSLADLMLRDHFAIAAVRRCFKEDEFIYADYQRQVEGHPTQDKFAVAWRKKNGGEVLDKREYPTLGRSFTIPELFEAIERVDLAYPSREHAAVDFARRIKQPLARLVEASRRYRVVG